MDQNEIFQAIGDIDDDLLLDAELAWERGPSRSRRHSRQLAAAACFLLAAVGALLWLRGGNAASSTDIDIPPQDSGSILPADSGGAEPFAPMDIRFNDAAQAPHSGSTSMFALLMEDFVPMTYEEALDYFGAALPMAEVLEVMPELTPAGGGCFGDRFGIYRTGERGTYFDENDFIFRDASAGKSLTVSLRTTFIPSPSLTEIQNSPRVLEPTRVKGWDLILFRYAGEDGSDRYHTEFSHNGVAWYVGGEGLTEEEFVRVLAALLEEKPQAAGPVTAAGMVTAVDARYGDFFDGQEHHYTENHDYITVELDGVGSLTIWLPGEADMYAVGDRVTVAYTGEPATIGHIWPGQLVGVTKNAP